MPSMPDLLEEKLRSQLEEEKKRYPFVSPHPASWALRDDLELRRLGRVATPQPTAGAALGSGSSSWVLK